MHIDQLQLSVTGQEAGVDFPQWYPGITHENRRHRSLMNICDRGVSRIFVTDNNAVIQTNT
jgi:hypothetical protein